MARQIQDPGRHRLPFILCAALLCAASFGATKTDLAGADLFDDEGVVRINITIPEGGMNALRRTPHWRGGGGQKRPEAKATISDGERTYNNVAIHLKGAAGSFREVDDRPGLTLNFDKFVKGQTFHGLEKFSLNNSVQDQSYMCEKIAREMFEKGGVPVPRSDYAVVTLNGRNLGLYVLAEGFNKQFLKRYFNKVGGNLYDGGFCQEIHDQLDLNSGDNPDDRSDIRRLISATEAARKNNKLDELEKALDVDRFIKMTAIEVLLCHWDGYAMNRNNYRVYHDLDSDRMVFMPHGLDQLFGIGQGSPTTSIRPQMNGMIARVVMGTTEGRSRYRLQLAEMRTNLFNVTEITNRIRQIEARLQPVLDEIRPRGSARLRNSINFICHNVGQRGLSLDQQLGAPTGELKFGSDGIALIDGWKPRNATSGANYDLVTSPEGKKFLYIKAAEGSSSASWRTRVAVNQGKYRFEGRIRSRGSGGDGAGGVVMRVSGARDATPVQAETGWKETYYEFEVQEPLADIELICELRGGVGEVWFETASLKVRRLAE